MPEIPAPVFTSPAHIQLSKEELSKIRSYSYGNERTFQHYLAAAKVQKYIGLMLVRDEARSVSRNLGRCFNGGTDFYRRRDGGKITPEDLAAVQQNQKGQLNAVKILDGGMEIQRIWECDSGD